MSDAEGSGDEGSPLTPADLLALARRLGLETKDEATRDIRRDRDSH